ncbi:hypothetical protein Barb4_04890 [Bacteroidales bacterium Barb4]|nr:hypothetical protein Barb4_04890 [Bacteroidales bacterium Barb4]
MEHVIVRVGAVVCATGSNRIILPDASAEIYHPNGYAGGYYGMKSDRLSVSASLNNHVGISPYVKTDGYELPKRFNVHVAVRLLFQQQKSGV